MGAPRPEAGPRTRLLVSGSGGIVRADHAAVRRNLPVPAFPRPARGPLLLVDGDVVFPPDLAAILPAPGGPFLASPTARARPAGEPPHGR